jgi:hypothetical protein
VHKWLEIYKKKRKGIEYVSNKVIKKNNTFYVPYTSSVGFMVFKIIQENSLHGLIL